jgi:hypothetical protein
MLKLNEQEICRLEDDNLLRPWLVLFSLIFPKLRPQFNLKMRNLKENCILISNGYFYTITINNATYSIKGHSHCIVTIWKNECQIGLIKRSNLSSSAGFESIEVLYDNQISLELLILFSIFGWERFVVTACGINIIETISLTKDTYDVNWRPKE